MANTKVTKILMRNGTTTEWELAPNPTLEQGEIGVEVDTYRMKIGTDDSPEAWDSIGYFAAGITSIQEVDSVHANGLQIDSVGNLDLNIDSVLADVDRIQDELDTVRVTADLARSTAVANMQHIININANIAHLDSVKLEDADLQPLRDQIESINSYNGSIDTINIRLDDLTDSVGLNNDSIDQISINLGLNVLEVLKNRDSINELGDSIDQISINLGLNVLEVLKNRDSINELRDSISGYNESISGLMDGQVVQDTDIANQRLDIDIIEGRLDTVETDVVTALDKAIDNEGKIAQHQLDIDTFILTNQDQWDSIYYFDSVLVEHTDSITSLDTLKLRSYPGETDALADGLIKGEVYHNEGLNHAVVVDRIAIPRLVQDSVAMSLEPYWSTNQNRHIVNDVYSKNEVDTMSSELGDSIESVSSRLDTVSATANSALTGYTLNNSAISSLSGRMDTIEVATAYQWDSIHLFEDSIEYLDSVVVTKDNIPSSKNNPAMADGGKLSVKDNPDGTQRYVLNKSLPLAEIVDSVVGSIGKAPDDTVSAVAAINAFFNIILNSYQPTVTFSVDDYDT